MKSVTQKINFFLKKCEIYFCDWLLNHILQNLFLQLFYPKVYIEDQIFAILGQNYKNKFHNNLFRNSSQSQKFLKKLFANLLKYKENTKVSVGIEFGKDLLTSCVLDSLTSMIA